MCERMVVKGTLFWRLKKRPFGVVNLAHARVGQLIDNRESWPEAGNLILDGFEYAALSGYGTPRGAVDRLRWLELQIEPQKPFRPPPSNPYWPQPYEQLAKVLRRMGHESDTRKVLIAKQEALRKYGILSDKERWWNWFLGRTVGHGWKPLNAVLILLGLFALGSGMFFVANYFEVMEPAKTQGNPEFNSIAYSLDITLPFLNLHQENYCLPDTSKPGGWYFRGWLWAQIILGWLFSALAAYSLSVILRKRE